MMDATELRANEIVERAMLGSGLCDEDISFLFSLDPTSKSSYLVQWAGQQLSMQAADGKAEIHAQIGLNGSPCPMNCLFCSFAVCNGIRADKLEMSKDDVIAYADAYVEAGANLILLLTTATYRFEKLLEMAEAVRETVGPEMPLLVNTGDMSYEQCMQLRSVGINGAYHAVRLGEGEVTRIPVEKRLETIENLKKAHLSISTCLEPMGPEHTPDELTEKTRMCIEMDAVSAGAGRRIPVPGTAMADDGIINNVRMAYYVALYRLATGLKPALNCSARATAIANAGGNLTWAEVGTNPRDTSERTEKTGRGKSVVEATKVFLDSEWEMLEGPSRGWMLDDDGQVLA